MMLPKEFFDIQVRFALKVSELDGISIEDALLKYTFLYRNFFIPSARFIKTKKEWVDFIQELQENNFKDITNIAYLYSEKRLLQRNMLDRPKYSGKPCFIAEIKDSKVYLHFNNNEGSDPGPLSQGKFLQRIEELVNIFRDIKNQYSEVTEVFCYSWLNNLHSFKRLFPIEFQQNKRVVKNDFKSLDLWGQFLDSNYSLRVTEASEFLNKIKSAKKTTVLKNSFRFYPVLNQCDITAFYTFYKI